MLHRELEDRNQSAAGSLAEGLAETLTLHRLGLYGVLGRSLKTTNCLESINALVEERCAKVGHWQNSSQRHRWLATALLDIEPRLRKVMGYPSPAHAPYRVEARTEDQHDNVEEESRVSNQEPSRVSTKNGLDSTAETVNTKAKLFTLVERWIDRRLQAFALGRASAAVFHRPQG